MKSELETFQCIGHSYLQSCVSRSLPSQLIYHLGSQPRTGLLDNEAKDEGMFYSS